MRGGSKTLAALAALLLLAGLAGCGGDSDSTTQAGGGAGESKASGGTSKQDGTNGRSSSGGEAGSGGDQEEVDAGDASEFKPKRHSDSGGGAEKFKVKGGDNSVQEFGEEADASEFDAIATIAHNFLDARAEGNWSAVCQYLDKSTIESIKRLSAQTERPCGEALAGLINPAAMASLRTEAEKADVRSLRIEGDQAFVIYTGAERTVLALPMTDEGGVWKVGSLASSPLN